MPGDAAGARSAAERLMPLVYDELRRLAHRYLLEERPNHTLQATALVNEAYLRLAVLDRMQWRDRTHFFAMAATAMRRVLVDHARERGRGKRGGGVQITSIGDRDVAGECLADDGIDVVALDAALTELQHYDERQCRIVELRFFAGFTIEETAQALGISPATVGREWLSARAWLHHRLSRS